MEDITQIRSIEPEMVTYGGVLMPRSAMEVISCWWSERTVARDLRSVKEGRCTPETLYQLGALASLSTPSCLPEVRQYSDAIAAAALI